MMLGCRRGLAAGLAVVVLVGSASLGVRAGQAKTAKDGVYTEAQASRGEGLYGQQCAACHSGDLSGSGAPALAGTEFAVRLGRKHGMPPHRFTVRLFHPRKPIALSDILPLAENLGLRVLSEAPFLLQAAGNDGVAVQALRVETADKSPVDLAAVGPRFAETLDRLWSGALENERKTLLQQLSTRLIQSGGIPELLGEILDAGIEITAADMGNIQLLDDAGRLGMGSLMLG